MQRIDVIVDGVLFLVNQRSNSDAVWTRIRSRAQTAAKVVVARHKAAPPPPPPPPPHPPPPPSVDLSRVRNLLVFATVTDEGIREALTLPPKWKFLFSADPTYKPSAEVAAHVIAAGRDANAWCDCSGTLPPAAKQMVFEYGLSDWYGQGETSAQFDVAVDAGAKAAIVNLSALTPSQLALVASASVLVVEENYRNVRPVVAPDWRNANAGIGGNCGAVYGSASEGAVYTPVRWQIEKGWFGVNDSWYVEGFQPDDWQAL